MLTHTERNVIIALAEKGERTSYELHKHDNVAKSNKTVHRTLEALADNNLVYLVHKEEEGRRRKWLWLTDEGVFQALTLIDYSQYRSVLEKAAEIRQKNTLFEEKIVFLLHLLSQLNKNHFHLILYYMNIARRRLQHRPVQPLPAIFMHAEFLGPWIRAALKHREYWPRIKQVVEELQTSLDMVYELVQQSGEEELLKAIKKVVEEAGLSESSQTY